MTSTFDKVVFLVGAIILIPVLLTPAGWMFGLLVAGLWILTAYGGRYLLQLERDRRKGERGQIARIRADGRRREEDQ